MKHNELLSFYKEWLAWAESDDPEDGIFRKDLALCGNYSVYLDANNTHAMKFDLLTSQFREHRLHQIFPFGSGVDYMVESRTETCHKNPVRLQWVRDRIAEAECIQK